MIAPTQLLKAMQIPVWIERGQEAFAIVAPPPAILIFLAESEDKFSPAHQEQLNKILAYLGFSNYELIYTGNPLPKSQADTIISFGVKYLPKYAAIPCITLSISDMLTNPSCKRQVLNDLKALKTE